MVAWELLSDYPAEVVGPNPQLGSGGELTDKVAQQAWHIVTSIDFLAMAGGESAGDEDRRELLVALNLDPDLRPSARDLQRQLARTPEEAQACSYPDTGGTNSTTPSAGPTAPGQGGQVDP